MTDFKLGRKPPKNAPALRLARILTAAVPTHPAAVDNLSALNGGWDMLGNDSAGDCVAVTWANFRRLVTTTLDPEHAYYPTQDQVWALYRTQNPEFDPHGSPSTNGPGSNADQGMDIQTALEGLVKNGGPDGVKAVAFAKVDHTNLAEVKAAIAIFGGVWTGITVLDANMADFNNGRPWEYSPNSQIDGGHSVLSGGYTDQASNDVDFITWAEETSFTDSYWQREVEECWIVIWPEHLNGKAFQEGVDLKALAADYAALTGKPFPYAPPAPPLPPIPTPVPPVSTLSVSVSVSVVDLSADFSAAVNSSAPITSYAWSFGDGVSASGHGPVASHKYAAPGAYTAILTVTDAAGSIAQGSTDVLASNPVPTPDAPPFPIAVVSVWLASKQYTKKSKKAAAAITAWLEAGGE